MACAFACLLFTPNHSTLQNTPSNWMITTKQAYKLRENKIHNQHDFGVIFDFVKYKAIFNISPLDLYFTKIPTQILFNKMWVQTNVNQISINLDLGEYSPINLTLSTTLSLGVLREQTTRKQARARLT
jgi:hypothetical protein